MRCLKQLDSCIMWSIEYTYTNDIRCKVANCGAGGLRKSGNTVIFCPTLRDCSVPPEQLTRKNFLILSQPCVCALHPMVAPHSTDSTHLLEYDK